MEAVLKGESQWFSNRIAAHIEGITCMAVGNGLKSGFSRNGFAMIELKEKSSIKWSG